MRNLRSSNLLRWRCQVRSRLDGSAIEPETSASACGVQLVVSTSSIKMRVWSRPVKAPPRVP
ncbi:MAG: hypothetical protein ACI8TP_000953 [Acidimicrobiales bacterium]